MTATDDIRAFLRAIIAAPDDDLPRLAFADWLDEHDRPARAEFIRVEVEIPRVPHGEPRRARLFERKDTLYRAHAAVWFARFSGSASDWRTGRGFVTAVTAAPSAFLAHADGWFESQPVRELKLLDVWSGFGTERRCHAREVFGSPLLGRLTHLDLERAGVNSAGVYYLSTNTALTRLRELVLRGNDITDDGAATLAKMPGLAGLESLDLALNGLTLAGGRALAASPYLTNLRELRLSYNRISGRGWRELEERFGPALVG